MGLESDTAALEAQIAHIRGTEVLGRSGTILRLFNFIAERTLAGTRPNEAEIAVEVFGRSGSFEAGQDAVVRVYVHRLRKKLADYYVRHPEFEHRLLIPRGEYRLTLAAVAGPVATVRPPVRISESRWLIALVVGGALMVGVAGGYMTGGRHSQPSHAFMNMAVWTPYRKSERPLLVVVGDYYIYGETDSIGNVQRLVREFSVNSREDLYEQMMIGEGESDNAIDLGLAYLPVSVAEALRAISPLLAHQKYSRIITASEFNPRMFQGNDVIYVGYMSGLQDLKDIVFRGGRYKIGESYDEIHDTKSGERYLSDSARANAPHGNNREYGYFTSIPGPSGARLTVIAGTRDGGLAGVAQAVTDPAITRRMSIPRGGGVEAIIEASGQEALGLAPRVVAMSGREAGGQWPAR